MYNILQMSVYCYIESKVIDVMCDACKFDKAHRPHLRTLLMYLMPSMCLFYLFFFVYFTIANSVTDRKRSIYIICMS